MLTAPNPEIHEKVEAQAQSISAGNAQTFANCFNAEIASRGLITWPDGDKTAYKINIRPVRLQEGRATLEYRHSPMEITALYSAAKDFVERQKGARIKSQNTFTGMMTVLVPTGSQLDQDLALAAVATVGRADGR